MNEYVQTQKVEPLETCSCFDLDKVRSRYARLIKKVKS